MTIPEFGPGDEVMLVCPAGAPPFPEGPARVVACTYFNPQNELSAYVVQYDDGRLESVDGVEMILYDAWAEWMKRNAN